LEPRITQSVRELGDMLLSIKGGSGTLAAGNLAAQHGDINPTVDPGEEYLYFIGSETLPSTYFLMAAIYPLSLYSNIPFTLSRCDVKPLTIHVCQIILHMHNLAR